EVEQSRPSTVDAGADQQDSSTGDRSRVASHPVLVARKPQLINTRIRTPSSALFHPHIFCHSPAPPHSQSGDPDVIRQCNVQKRTPTGRIELASIGAKSESSEDTKNDRINRIAFRAPPHVPNEPEMWFSQLEHSFASAGISGEASKFSYLCSTLDPRY
ncbi:hypothetical protein TSAR_002499, partial [Trichomalopsis sarcophagae]